MISLVRDLKTSVVSYIPENHVNIVIGNKAFQPAKYFASVLLPTFNNDSHNYYINFIQHEYMKFMKPR